MLQVTELEREHARIWTDRVVPVCWFLTTLLHWPLSTVMKFLMSPQTDTFILKPHDCLWINAAYFFVKMLTAHTTYHSLTQPTSELHKQAGTPLVVFGHHTRIHTLSQAPQKNKTPLQRNNKIITPKKAFCS